MTSPDLVEGDDVYCGREATFRILEPI